MRRASAVKLLIAPFAVAVLLVACAPAASIEPSRPYVGRPYSGPVEGIAVVMSTPQSQHRQFSDVIYVQSLAGFSRHPFARSRFDMVERSEIDQIIQEHRLSSSGFVDTQTAPELGQLLGAHYLLMVDIAALDVRESRVGGLRLGGIRLGGGGATLSVALMMRLIDTTTGRVVSTGYGEAASSTISSLSVGGASVNSPVTVGALQDLVPEAVVRALNELFMHLDI